MQNLPTAEVYEKEFTYMPWGMLIKEIETYISKNVPKDGTLLDLLCGPGYLLGKLHKQRNDLTYHGVDLEPEFIDAAKRLYAQISFEVADVSKWRGKQEYDAVVVTGGLHHLPPGEQEPFVEKVSKLIKKEGFAIIGDPYIDDFANEKERKIAGAKLGYEYLVATIQSGGTEDVIDAAIGVMVNDIKLVEWKSSVKKNKPIFEKYFSSVEEHKTWPASDSEYGDYYFVLRK